MANGLPCHWCINYQWNNIYSGLSNPRINEPSDYWYITLPTVMPYFAESHFAENPCHLLIFLKRKCRWRYLTSFVISTLPGIWREIYILDLFRQNRCETSVIDGNMFRVSKRIATKQYWKCEVGDCVTK